MRTQEHLPEVSIPSVKLWFCSSAKREDLAVSIGDRSFVIYFFSGSARDMVQAQAFREHSPRWAARQYEVLGVSSLSPEWLQKWAKRLNLPYDLASDSSLELADRIGVGAITSSGSRIYERCALIVSKGKVRAVFDSVTDRPGGEAERVTEWLDQHERNV